MKKQLMKYIAIIATVVMICFSVCATVSALNERGQCGDNANYTFYRDTGKLVISGTGAISEGAFNYDESIKIVIIKDGITSIEKEAFYGCVNLEIIEIPDSVTFIGKDILKDTAWFNYQNSGLVVLGDWIYSYKGIDLSKTYTLQIDSNIRGFVDGFLSNLRCFDNIEVAASNAVFSSVNGVLFNSDKTVIIRFPEEKQQSVYKIPETVVVINDWAFARCTSLKSISMSNSVTTIGDWAFYECVGLKNIFLGNNVKTIGDYAFLDASHLNVSVPVSVTDIGRSAFSWIDSIFYEGSHEQWDLITKGENITGGVAELYLNHKHLYTSEITKKANCTTSGTILYTCTHGDSYEEELPATGHTEVDVAAKLPTCTQDGRTEGKECSVCGEVTVGAYIIPALGHSEEIITGTNADCVNSGISEGLKCTVCDEVILEQEIIPATGHNYQAEWQTIIAPTCTATGVSIKICLGCFDIQTSTLPTVDHADTNGDYKCDMCSLNMTPLQPEKPEIPENPSENCDCRCHKSGIAKFFFNIGLFFQKLFKKNAVCACGVAHY